MPLWTALMRPYFKYGKITASSSTVESYFNDLKNRQLKKLPQRVDDFLVNHLRYIEGE